MKAPLLIFLALLFSLSGELSAQTSLNLPLKIAPTIGINRTNWADNEGDFEDGEPKGRLSIGVKAFSSMESQLYYQTGVFYNSKGYFEDLEDGDYLDISLNYLEVPFNVGYRYPINEQFSVTGFGGAYAAFALGGKYEEEYFGDYDSFNIFDPDEDYGVRRLDGGINLGLSLEVNKQIVLSLQQSFGIINLVKPDPDFDSDLRITNRAFNVSVSYVLK